MTSTLRSHVRSPSTGTTQSTVHLRREGAQIASKMQTLHCSLDIIAVFWKNPALGKQLFPPKQEHACLAYAVTRCHIANAFEGGMSLMTKKTFDEYRLKFATAQVYLGISGHSRVAVKLQPSQNPRLLKKAMAEINMMHKCQHEHIIRLLGVMITLKASIKLQAAVFQVPVCNLAP